MKMKSNEKYTAGLFIFGVLHAPAASTSCRTRLSALCSSFLRTLTVYRVLSLYH
jgi:hypothetical protein